MQTLPQLYPISSQNSIFIPLTTPEKQQNKQQTNTGGVLFEPIND